MRSIIFSIIFFTCQPNFSQIKTPRISPATEITQMVGLTEIKIKYSRPSARDREIFGELVPFNKIWRTGADNSTKINFSTDISIGDELIKAGEYSIFSIPDKNKWQIIFYSETDLWGVPRDWSDDKISYSFFVDVKKIKKDSFIETFLISFENISNNDVDIKIGWENTSVVLNIDVPTRKLVENDIENVMSGNPSSSDYYAAAVYYKQENIKLDKALEWINLAIDMSDSPRFWQYRQQSLIMAANGKYKEAIEAANNSLKLAKDANNESYVKMNKESIFKWTKKLKSVY